MSMKSSHSSRKRANDVIGQIFVALYPYVGDVGDLTFAKGEEIVVLNCDDGDWYVPHPLCARYTRLAADSECCFFIQALAATTIQWAMQAALCLILAGA
jgi:hypothetical protein